MFRRSHTIASPLAEEAPQTNSRRGFLRSAAVVGAASAVSVGLPHNASAVQPASVAGLTLPPAGPDITRFDLHVPQSALVDLRRRLAAARLPERETVDDVSQGVPLSRLRGLVEHWRTSYDWRALESRLNEAGQYRTRIDGLGIHFLHVPSRHPDALPVILNHGWPGSFVEFLDTIGPLTDPTRYGGSAQDAFHVVIPSMPGHGFSDRPAQAGWDPARIASAWINRSPARCDRSCRSSRSVEETHAVWQPCLAEAGGPDGGLDGGPGLRRATAQGTRAAFANRSQRSSRNAGQTSSPWSVRSRRGIPR
ncbi:epoxide hydrolase family protein [Streptomyces canarius]